MTRKDGYRTNLLDIHDNEEIKTELRNLGKGGY